MQQQNRSISVSPSQARDLITQQFPQWKALPIKPVPEQGWDNQTFRLGEALLIRFPKGEIYAQNIKKEYDWLPKLAPFLPLKIPQPLAIGRPGYGYPWCWSVYRWIRGSTLFSTPPKNLESLVTPLTGFLKALHGISSTGGPQPEPHEFAHPNGLHTYDAQTRLSLDRLKNKIDTSLALSLWEEALETEWTSPSVWVHGDISAGNLLVENNRLTAVLDFGGLAVGDPACDLVIAWKFFDSKTRKAFQNALPLDKNTWIRARAWALWKASIIAAGLSESNAVETSTCWHTLHETLSEL